MKYSDYLYGINNIIWILIYTRTKISVIIYENKRQLDETSDDVLEYINHHLILILNHVSRTLKYSEYIQKINESKFKYIFEKCLILFMAVILN